MAEATMPDPGARSRGLSLALILGLSWLAAAPRAFAGAAGARPSVLLIVVDALRPDRLSPYGSPRDTSPRLSLLAARGSLFRDVWAQANWTVPSLASLMTGLYPSAHGAVEFPGDPAWAEALEAKRFVPWGRGRLSPARDTLAAMFARHGYRTGAVVSGAFCRSDFGFGNGFREYHDLGGPMRGLMPRVKEVLAREPGRPFFVYLHLGDVHDPYDPSPPFDTMWDPDYAGAVDGSRKRLGRISRGQEAVSAGDLEHLKALYDGSITELDAGLGELLEFAASLPGGGNTVIALTADHGEAFLEHGRLQHGHSAYEEELRVPLILQGPGIPGGALIAEPAGLVDLAPTLLDACGLAIPPGLHGRSLLPLLSGGGRKARPLYAEASDLPRSLAAIAVREGRFKLVRGLDGRPDRLFDLKADPLERRDLAADRAGTARRLRRLADGILASSRADGARLPPIDEDAPPPDPGLTERLRAAGYLP